MRQSIKNIKAQAGMAVKGMAIAAMFVLFIVPLASSCGGSSKKSASKTKQTKQTKPAAGAQQTPGTPTATAADGTPVFGEYNDQLIADAELDQFKGQFSTDVGREDPFEFVPYSSAGGAGMIDKGMQENPDMYRVIGTARTTPSGPAALIQLGGDTFVVHEGDEIDKAVIKRIDLRDVLIEMNGREFTLSMRTRKRTVPAPDMTQEGMEMTQLGKLQSQMGKFDSLYEEYLNSKYGKTDFFEGERKEGPNNFNDYLKEREKLTYENPKVSPF